jgi:uncharacterized protein (DUF433 family)
MPGLRKPDLEACLKYKSEYKAADFEELRNKLMGALTLEQLEDAADYQLNTEILRSR